MDKRKMFLDRAHENIQAAQLLFDYGLYNISAGRSYYAALLVANVALNYFDNMSLDNIDHKSTYRKFVEKLVQEQRIFSSDLAIFLEDLRLIRNKADYSPKPISKQVALEQLKNAKEFIEYVKMEIK